MDGQLGRRSVLALSAAGALMAALTACTGGTADETQLLDYGYDPDIPESVTPQPPPRLAKVPPAASVRTEWLPPVGKQTMPNCYAWASVYGLATFCAALKSQTPPTKPARQASPDYTYIRFEAANRIDKNTCVGGQITKCLDWVKSNGGTPSLAAAPNLPGHRRESSCQVNWTAYGSQPIPPDSRFVVPNYKATKLTGPDGLNNLRSVIASGMPIVYGTSLYTDFPHYRGKPDPYVGNGQLLYHNGKKVGHVMLIIGYDDAHKATTGAVRIQNSFGTGWGSNGFVWMAYDAFQATAQGRGVYVPA
jgi:hypothetical protein